MDRYTISMMDWKNHLWRFSSAGPVGIPQGGLQGLGGKTRDVTVTPISGCGQKVVDQLIEPIAGTLRFHCRANGRSVGRVAAELRAAFSPLRSRQNTLRIATSNGAVSLSIRANGPVGDPVEDPGTRETVLGLEIPIIADEGVWWHDPTRSVGTSCHVNNWGDVPIPVSLRWQGQGGRVTLPSGASLTLPQSSQPRRLTLSRNTSMMVTDDAGNRDEPLRKRISGLVPVTVQPGETALFTIPHTAELTWRVGVLNPWQ